MNSTLKVIFIVLRHTERATNYKLHTSLLIGIAATNLWKFTAAINTDLSKDVSSVSVLKAV